MVLGAAPTATLSHNSFLNGRGAPLTAYLLKEDFQQFWEYESPSWAGKFLDEWCCQVMRSRIEPMKKIAQDATLAPRADPELLPRQEGSSPAVWSRVSTTRPN